MAIDPNIALQGTYSTNPVQLNMGAAALQGIQGAQVQQQTANLAAAQPGIVADSATKARNLAAKQWIGQNLGDYQKTDPAGGPAKIDYSGLNAAMTAAGYADFSPSLIQDMLGNQTTSILNSTNQQTLNQNRYDAGLHQAQVAAQTLAPLPVDQQAARYYQIRAHNLANFGSNVVTDGNMPATFDPNWVKSTAAGSITAENTGKLANDTQNAQTNYTNAKTSLLSVQGSLADKSMYAQNDVNDKMAASDTLSRGSQGMEGLDMTGAPAPAAALAQWKDWVKGDPSGRRSAALAGVQELNALHPGANYTLYSPGIGDQMKFEGGQKNSQAQGMTRAWRELLPAGGPSATSSLPQPSVPGVTTPEPNAAATSTTPASGPTPDASGNVRVVRKSDGKTGKIPLNKFNPTFYNYAPQ